MILARHAESLFWVGRYLERAEMTSRWLDVAGASAMHLAPADARIDAQQLVIALSLEDIYEATHDQYDHPKVAAFLLVGADNPGSVTSGLTALRDNLRVARDRIPVELWEEVNRLHLRLGSIDVSGLLDAEPHEIYSLVREGCQAISGVIAEAMTRDEGHAFIVVGRMLERAILTVGLLRAAYAHARGTFDGDRLLRSTSALQAYRRFHGQHADPTTTARFLLEAENVPRSVLSCLKRAEGRLTALSADADSLTSAQRQLGRLRSLVEYGDLAVELERSPVDALDRLERELLTLGDTISAQVFRPPAEPLMHAEYVRPGGQTP